MLETSVVAVLWVPDAFLGRLSTRLTWLLAADHVGHRPTAAPRKHARKTSSTQGKVAENFALRHLNDH